MIGEQLKVFFFKSEDPISSDEVLTIFQETIRLPPYLVALSIFNSTDFVHKETMTEYNTTVCILFKF